jgi:ABC-2 type transport system ATP-binding protein
MATAPAIVEVGGLVASYGDVQAVTDVSMSVRQGELVALLGPNGAGKSTAIACLLGLHRPDRGTLSVVSTTPHAAVRAGKVGAMLQVSGLPVGARVREVLGLSVALHHHNGPSVDELLELSELGNLSDRDATQLSGGQAQRLRFAMALAGSPSLLFLDEATAGMDVESREVFWKAVRAMTGAGTTVLFTTHYLEEADRYADRIVMIARGRVVGEGTAGELKSQLGGGRTIEFTTDDPDAVRALELPGVDSISVQGRTLRIRTTQSDAAVGLLYRSGIAFSELTVSGSDLDQVMLALSHEDD